MAKTSKTTKKKVAASSASKTNKTKKSSITAVSLHSWNKWLAVLHAVQGLAIIVLSTAKTFSVTTSYVAVDSLATEANGSPVLAGATRNIIDINLAWLVATFFFMSALAHAVIATVYRKRYETDLKKGINKARWIEYAASSSTMLVAIGILTGISDLSTLFMLFVFGVVMNLMGLAMELFNQGKSGSKLNWLPFWVGSVAGAVPWVVLAIYLAGANLYGSGNIPTFVYWIYASIFIFFNCFALNMYLQYKAKGKWAEYLYGERAYMILSLVAKSALAWQVFAGTLRP